MFISILIHNDDTLNMPLLWFFTLNQMGGKNPNKVQNLPCLHFNPPAGNHQALFYLDESHTETQRGRGGGGPSHAASALYLTGNVQRKTHTD